MNKKSEEDFLDKTVRIQAIIIIIAILLAIIILIFR
jgi:hypothetical protein